MKKCFLIVFTIILSLENFQIRHRQKAFFSTAPFLRVQYSSSWYATVTSGFTLGKARKLEEIFLLWDFTKEVTTLLLT